jgi:hypothetical protein
MAPAVSTNMALVRTGAVSAPAGAVVFLVSTLLHPMDSDPNDAHAAFAEYAADSFWVWSHIGQFLGVAVLGITLVALAATLEPGRTAIWSRMGLAGTAATIAVAAALQAVDGVALKVMVDRWAAASGEARVLAFEAAFAVRQIEIGLASLLSVLFGFTAVVFSAAILLGDRYPAWFGAAALLSGLGMLTAGMAMALTGFSGLAMMLSMLGSSVFLLWIIFAGLLMWRLAARDA